MRLFSLPPPNRRKRHAMLAVFAILSVVTLYSLLGYSPERWVDIPDLKASSPKWRLSMSLAYTALGFLAVTLLIGPVNVLLKRRNPANIYLRRDIGIWAGLIALSHMCIGMLIHSGGITQIWTLFLDHAPNQHNLLPIRTSVFGLANYAGLAQALVLILILAISNDYAFNKLGVKKWKRLQRLVYLALALIVVHGLSYQTVEQRDQTMRLLFAAVVSTIVIVQLAGFITRLYRRRKRVKPVIASQIQGVPSWTEET